MSSGAHDRSDRFPFSFEQQSHHFEPNDVNNKISMQKIEQFMDSGQPKLQGTCKSGVYLRETERYANMLREKLLEEKNRILGMQLNSKETNQISVFTNSAENYKTEHETKEKVAPSFNVEEKNIPSAQTSEERVTCNEESTADKEDVKGDEYEYYDDEEEEDVISVEEELEDIQEDDESQKIQEIGKPEAFANDENCQSEEEYEQPDDDSDDDEEEDFEEHDEEEHDEGAEEGDETEENQVSVDEPINDKDDNQGHYEARKSNLEHNNECTDGLEQFEMFEEDIFEENEEGVETTNPHENHSEQLRDLEYVVLADKIELPCEENIRRDEQQEDEDMVCDGDVLEEEHIIYEEGEQAIVEEEQDINDEEEEVEGEEKSPEKLHEEEAIQLSGVDNLLYEQEQKEVATQLKEEEIAEEHEQHLTISPTEPEKHAEPDEDEKDCGMNAHINNEKIPLVDQKECNHGELATSEAQIDQDSQIQDQKKLSEYLFINKTAIDYGTTLPGQIVEEPLEVCNKTGETLIVEILVQCTNCEFTQTEELVFAIKRSFSIDYKYKHFLVLVPFASASFTLALIVPKTKIKDTIRGQAIFSIQRLCDRFTLPLEAKSIIPKVISPIALYHTDLKRHVIKIAITKGKKLETKIPIKNCSNMPLMLDLEVYQPKESSVIQEGFDCYCAPASITLSPNSMALVDFVLKPTYLSTFHQQSLLPKTDNLFKKIVVGKCRNSSISYSFIIIGEIIE